jgi:hypothetical protein
MFFVRVISHLLSRYEHSDYHGDQIAFSQKGQLCQFRIPATPLGRLHTTATVQQMPSATATVVNLPSAQPVLGVMTGGRAWRKASSHLLKGLGPLEPASLGKPSQGIKTVFAVSISRENLSGIVRWAFISLN